MNLLKNSIRIDIFSSGGESRINLPHYMLGSSSMYLKGDFDSRFYKDLNSLINTEGAIFVIQGMISASKKEPFERK